ncbi:MAG: homocysteine S-methyltransferase family protein [Cytophagales bacterium]|nr:homocysteine S-methyltransferase family protein [Cytophagales bacterium]
MGKIIDKIKAGETLISDGAWGTFLQEKGLQPGECPELWNITRPDDVFDIAKGYIEAGSDMIETNSFGGSKFKLANYGLENQVYGLNKAAAEISRKAAGPEKFVLGSIGPTGKILMTGETTEEALYNAFKEQAIALEAGGADAIIIETMTDLEEAIQAIKAARAHTGCEIFCTMTFDKTVNSDFRSMMGVSPTDMVDRIVEAGAELIGANCGNGIRDMVSIVKEIRLSNTEIPVLIHANAGMPVYRDGKTVFPESPGEMAGVAGELIAAGANIIGGCCGTTPAHISKIAEVVKK